MTINLDFYLTYVHKKNQYKIIEIQYEFIIILHKNAYFISKIYYILLKAFLHFFS